MLDFFYTLLRLPLPEWTDEFSVAILATDPSRVQDAWKLQDGYIALEGKTLLPHVSKFRYFFFHYCSGIFVVVQYPQTGRLRLWI